VNDRSAPPTAIVKQVFGPLISASSDAQRAMRKRWRMIPRPMRWLIAIGGILLLLLPRAFSPVNGAYLSIQIGSLSVQPAEFAKIAIVIFLASYLRDTRQLLVTAGRRVAGLTIPRSSGDQIAAGERLTADTPGAGDLVQYPGHVMMYLGVPGTMVHSPYTGRRVEVDFIPGKRINSVHYADPVT
jgi:hypothetical protein